MVLVSGTNSGVPFGRLARRPHFSESDCGAARPSPPRTVQPRTACMMVDSDVEDRARAVMNYP